MFYVITVSLIISILALILTLKKMRSLQRKCSDLQVQLKEHELAAQQSPDDKLRSIKQKVEHARQVLVPKTLWKPGVDITEVAYHQGMLYALNWLEDNHAKTQIGVRHLRT